MGVLLTCATLASCQVVRHSSTTCSKVQPVSGRARGKCVKGVAGRKKKARPVHNIVHINISSPCEKCCCRKSSLPMRYIKIKPTHYVGCWTHCAGFSTVSLRLYVSPIYFSSSFSLPLFLEFKTPLHLSVHDAEAVLEQFRRYVLTERPRPILHPTNRPVVLWW